MTRNEFKHKDKWYNLFEKETTNKFLTIDPEIDQIVYPFFFDNSEGIKA